MIAKDPEVSGWAPDFLPADEQLTQQAEGLRSLLGARIIDAWAVWNLEHDEWFADSPVGLQMDGARQLEVCWEKFDDLSITWDTIDVSVTPKAWVEWPLAWRRQPLSPLALIVGATVEELAASSFLFETQNVDHHHDKSAVWLTTGLWIGAATGGLHIVNSLDENGVDARPPVRDEHDWRAN